jgi:hypothetical protein
MLPRVQYADGQKGRPPFSFSEFAQISFFWTMDNSGLERTASQSPA